MNNGFTNSFPGKPIYSGDIPIPNQQSVNNDMDFEQSYIENILRLNRGKKADVFMSFPDSKEWSDKVFSGIIEQSGRDHIILSDPQTGKWYLLKMIYVDYILFDEKITSNVEFYPNN